MGDTSDPCQQFRDELANIDAALGDARAEAQQAREILLHYRGIICRGTPYTEEDCNWIGDILADSRTEQDSYEHAPNAYNTIDNNRPLIGAAHHQSIELGKARDRIRALRTQHEAASQKLRDCVKQNQQSQSQAGEPQNGEVIADAGCALCGQARVGHGHEGEPCRVHLGSDGLCQYHDVA